MDLQLEGKVYIVTGATSGLGRAVASELVREGANVVVASRNGDRVNATVAVVGPAAVGCVIDITDPTSPQRLIRAARSAFDRLDGLFVSHGGPPAGPAATLSDEDLDRALALAAAGPIRLIRDVAADLTASDVADGSIVALTSVSSVEPIPGLAASNLSRTSVWGYCKTLADEVAAQGLRVNVLLPGRFATERLDELHLDLAERQGRDFDTVRAEVTESIPLRRIGDPVELARVAAFLLSPASSYVTGSAWRVDGGSVRGL